MEIIFTRHIMSAELVKNQETHCAYVYETRKIRVGSKFFGIIPIYEKKTGIFDRHFSSGNYVSLEEFNNYNKRFFYDIETKSFYKKSHVIIVFRNATKNIIYAKNESILENLIEDIKTKKFIQLQESNL